MMPAWYIQDGEHQFGPYSDQELKRVAGTGKVTPETLVRQGENGNWFRADQISGLLSPLAPPIAPQMKERQADSAEMYQKVGKQIENVSQKLVFLDFGFTTFLTPKLVTLCWILWIVIGTVTAVVSLSQAPLTILRIVLAVLAYLIYLLFGRIWLETMVVLFKIEKHLRDLRDKQ